MPVTSSRTDLPSPLVHSVEQEKVCVDDMLQKYCGEFGWWQLKHFVLTSLAWTLEALHAMVMIFADREPEWRCLSNDGRSSGGGCLSPAGSVCGLKTGSWEWIDGPASSTVAEWGLVCEEKYKVGLVQSLFFAGCMIGAGTFGHLSDSFLGRKGSLIAVCILNSISGCLTALSPNFWIYALLRFLTGFSTGGVGLCAFVLATEPIGPTKRGTAGMSTFYFFSLGIILLSGIAYLFQTWRTLYIATTIPSILFLVILIFIDDSPRWYLIRGKVNQAMKVMKKIAYANGRDLPEGVILALDEEVNRTSTEENDEKEKEEEEEAMTGSVLDVFNSPLTRMRLLLSVTINFLCAVVYYGLSLNVVNLGTNIYLNVFLNAAAEMPAFLLTAILMDKFGRRSMTIGTLWFSGIFCLLGSLMGGNGVWKIARMVCGILGIFGVAGTYNLLYVYTVELFPTVVRNAALGCSKQGSQTGAILSPFVVVLGGGLPFLVFGICGFVGGLLAFYLPETSNRPLYDTMDGMEEGEKSLLSA